MILARCNHCAGGDREGLGGRVVYFGIGSRDSSTGRVVVSSRNQNLPVVQQSGSGIVTTFVHEAIRVGKGCRGRVVYLRGRQALKLGLRSHVESASNQYCSVRE